MMPHLTCNSLCGWLSSCAFRWWSLSCVTICMTQEPFLPLLHAKIGWLTFLLYERSSMVNVLCRLLGMYSLLVRLSLLKEIQSRRIQIYVSSFSTLKRVEKERYLQPIPGEKGIPLKPEEVK